jgi:hypothetical protein
MDLQSSTHRSDPPAQHRDPIRQVLQTIGSVGSGHIQIVIQESRVAQIDQAEKLRLV